MRLQITVLSFPLILLLNISIATAQNDDSFDAPKNVIHGSIGTVIAYSSGNISYDRLIKKSDNGFFKSYYITGKIGENLALDFSGANSGTGNLYSLGVTALTGRGKNHFEIGIGLGYFMDTENIIGPSNPFGSSNESTFYLNFSIGYRKQIAQGFMFRTGVGMAEWAYVGFGYSF